MRKARRHFDALARRRTGPAVGSGFSWWHPTGAAPAMRGNLETAMVLECFGRDDGDGAGLYLTEADVRGLWIDGRLPAGFETVHDAVSAAGIFDTLMHVGFGVTCCGGQGLSGAARRRKGAPAVGAAAP